jgi:aminoglycoside phosphotransferase (APT) family kinase protein
MHDEVAPTFPLAAADGALADGLARWMTHRKGLVGARVNSLSRPVSGYSSETIFADVSWSDNKGRHQNSFVVRMAPPDRGTFAHYDLVPQWEAQLAASGVGVPVADPEIEVDSTWLGADFIVMPRIDGHIIGAVAHRDPWLRGIDPIRRGQVFDGLLATLAAIHRAAPEAAPAVPRRDNKAELDYWEEYLSWSTHGKPVPALARALKWCRVHRPAHEPDAALLWGDVRFENMIVDDGGQPLAVLDWDMPSVGAPEHDLAWFTSLDFVMHAMFGKRTEGFPDRQGTVTRFEELSGRPILDLEWYETLAMVRSTAVMTRISVLRGEAGEPLMLPIEDNPILDLLTERLT